MGFKSSLVLDIVSGKP